MTSQTLMITKFLDVSGHLTRRGIEAIRVEYCSDEGGLPEEIIPAIQRHIGLWAGSPDYRDCDEDCQERVIDSLGADGVQRAVEKGLFTAVAAR